MSDDDLLLGSGGTLSSNFSIEAYNELSQQLALMKDELKHLTNEVTRPSLSINMLAALKW